MKDNTDKSNAVIIDIMRNQIKERREENIKYNSHFITSTMSTVLISAIGLCVINSDMEITPEIIYIVIFACLLSLYNIIKYTGFQIENEAFCSVQEYKISKMMGASSDIFDLHTRRGFEFKFWGAGVQLFFGAPVAIVFASFFVKKLEHDPLWFFVLISAVIACIILLIMAFRLIKLQERTLKKFNFEVTENGWIKKIK